MGMFESARTLPIVVRDLGPVAADVMQHFRAQEFEVTGTPKDNGGWHISITKGGTFKMVVGMRTALNVEIEPRSAGTTVKAGVGLFGHQAIPTAITLLFFWPILLVQIWTLVQQSKLDEEALEVAERSLRTHSGAPAASG